MNCAKLLYWSPWIKIQSPALKPENDTFPFRRSNYIPVSAHTSCILAQWLCCVRANADCGLSWTKVKEVGLSVEDCSCLAQDAFRIFGVYWSIGGVINGSLPPYWPARLSALSSSQKPLHLKFNGVPAQVYLSVSILSGGILLSSAVILQELCCIDCYLFYRHRQMSLCYVIILNAQWQTDLFPTLNEWEYPNIWSGINKKDRQLLSVVCLESFSQWEKH